MKFLTILGDGMSGLPFDRLGGRTALEAANKPAMDALAERGELALVCNVPQGMPPGSDTANMSAMGFDPALYYSGRSPLEAVSMGIDMTDTDVAFRVNLVSLSDEEQLEDKCMLDYSSGEITTAESTELIGFLSEQMDWADRSLHAGKSYRHCLIWPSGPHDTELTPPHDISGRPVRDYLPKGDGAAVLLALMRQSAELLREHPVNQKRRAAGLRTADILWPWGLGTKPALPALIDLHHVQGAVISAVDLVQGIGKLCGMDVRQVEGATGTLHSNFAAKTAACINAFEEGSDYVYLHMEAPDECGHQGDEAGKVRSIELIDRQVLAPLWAYLESLYRQSGEPYRILLLPDHPTPLSLRTHSSDPVPYVLYDSALPQMHTQPYTEAAALKNMQRMKELEQPQPAVGHELVTRYLRQHSRRF